MFVVGWSFDDEEEAEEWAEMLLRKLGERKCEELCIFPAEEPDTLQ